MDWPWQLSDWWSRHPKHPAQPRKLPYTRVITSKRLPLLIHAKMHRSWFFVLKFSSVCLQNSPQNQQRSLSILGWILSANAPKFKHKKSGSVDFSFLKTSIYTCDYLQTAASAHPWTDIHVTKILVTSISVHGLALAALRLVEQAPEASSPATKTSIYTCDYLQTAASAHPCKNAQILIFCT